MAGSESQYAPASTPKEPLLKRLKGIWRFSMIVNLAVGAYIFAHAGKKNGGKHVENVEKAKPESLLEEYSDPYDSIVEKLTPLHREPISEDQQRELFKWMLEEKRQMKPSDRGEKKRVNEEKAILKKFIGAKTIPRI
ncbi:unnamed protein product [Linum trigynum]|uniref:Transmembrane protein n=1 Tax=Linum trigynum TaxID=586398 RepID=A0AAV2GUK8_9ROSI